MKPTTDTQKQSNYFLVVLKREFAKRQRTNAAYSLRSFAKYLGVPASSLALILKDKRPFPFSAIPLVCNKLNLSPEERREFVRSVQLRRASLAALTEYKDPSVDTVLDDESYFRVIAEWEHYAVLHLMDIDGFEANPALIAARLGITETRAADVLERLLDCGLLAKDENTDIYKTYAHVKTTDDVISPALRKAHKEALEMGIKKLESISIEKRDFSSLTLAIDPDHLPQFKKFLKEFRQKLTAFSEEGVRREVYQICFQMYPLTCEGKEIKEV